MYEYDCALLHVLTVAWRLFHFRLFWKSIATYARVAVSAVVTATTVSILEIDSDADLGIVHCVDLALLVVRFWVIPGNF